MPSMARDPDLAAIHAHTFRVTIYGHGGFEGRKQQAIRLRHSPAELPPRNEAVTGANTETGKGKIIREDAE
jgi:hypothetical protein